MEKFKNIKSIPAYLPLINIDTDKIIPKQFLKTIKRSGLGKSLFYEMRFDEKNNPIKGFILDNDPYRNSKILITGKNFGCGSSREHAPWALQDFGFKCIIAPSFGDIFFNNCFQNGVLPVVLPEDVVAKIIENSEKDSEYRITIDLETQRVWDENEDVVTEFNIEPFRQHCMLNGLDDIGLTLESKDAIDEFESRRPDNGSILTF